MSLFRLVAVGFLFILATTPGFALGPADVYLVINKNVLDSRAIAEHYCRKRHVPVDHILALELPASEDISRHDYDTKLAAPLREMLRGRRDKVKVLVTVYGVPLRVGGQLPSAAEQAELDKLKKEAEPLRKEQARLAEAVKKLEEAKKKEPKGQAATELPLRQKEQAEAANRLRQIEARRHWLSHAESHAAVDSELALLWHSGFELRRWQMNLLYFQVPADFRDGVPPTVMTCRLDGPSPALIKRLIDKSVEVEKKGLAGKAYFDARGIRFDPKTDPSGTGYGGYDESLREAARLLEKQGGLTVVLDDKPELFAVGQCTDCRSLLRLVLARQLHRLLPVRPRCRRLPHRQLRGGLAARPEIESLVPEPAASRRGRHARPGRRAVHRRLPQAGRVLRPARHRRIHAGRVLLEDRPVHELDDHPCRRPALQPVQNESTSEARPGQAESHRCRLPGDEGSEEVTHGCPKRFFVCSLAKP